MVKRIKHSSYCFGCGKSNFQGLILQFREVGASIEAEFIPDEYCQGQPGIVHGGIIAALMDEAASQFLHRRGIPAMTSAMKIKIRRQLVIGESVQVSASLSNRKKTRKISRRNYFFLEVIIVGEKGKIAESFITLISAVSPLAEELFERREPAAESILPDVDEELLGLR